MQIQCGFVRVSALALLAFLVSISISTFVSHASETRAALILKNPSKSASGQWVGLSIPELSEIGEKAISNPDSFPRAIKAFTTIVDLYEGGAYDKSDIRKVVSAMNNLGYVYTFHYLDYQKGISYLNHALDLAESNDIKEIIPVICLNLGAIYSLNQIYFAGIRYPDKSISIYSKGLKTAMEVEDWENYLKLLNNIFSLTISHSHKALPAEVLEGFSKLPVTAKRNIMYPFTRLHAEAYRTNVSGDYDRASAICSEMESKTSGFQDDIRYQLMAISEKAAIEERRHEYNSAVREIDRGLDISFSHGYDDVSLIFYDDARRLYTNIGDKNKAEKYYVSYLKLKDSIFNACSMKAVSEIDFHNKIDQMEDTVRDLSYHKRIQNIWLWILGIFSLLAILFVGYYNYSNRKLRQRNRSLYRKNLINIEAEDRNFELKKENDELRTKISEITERNRNGETPLRKDKYSYSQLNDARKESIRKKIEDVIEEDPEVFSQEFSLGTLAAKVGCPQTYLSQVIGEKMGGNFYNLLSERRIKEACRIMSDPSKRNLSIEGVAAEVGIKSRSNFSTLFKKITGLTPGEFARQTRAE